MTKCCTGCGLNKEPSEFGRRNQCKACKCKQSLEWYHNRGGADRVRRNNRLKRYGVTDEWFTGQMQAQGGLCANQRCPKPATAVDHNHATGKVRSILCGQCNTALGLLKESISRAEGLIDYIRSHA